MRYGRRWQNTRMTKPMIYDTNSYSVPVQFCGQSVAIKALPERIEIFHSGNLIAVHQSMP